MRSITRIVALLLLVPALAVPAAAGADAERDAATALRHFLRVDCASEQPGSAMRPLLAHRDQAEPELARVLAEGPDAAMLEARRSALEEQWDRREAFLRSNPDLGLNPDDLLTVHSVQREEFVEGGIARFSRTARERAVHGLAALGTRTSRSTLREQSRLVDAELREMIRVALERFRSEHRGPSRNPQRRRAVQRIP